MKKTAKRIICLVLCVVMLTSIFAVGASADCKPYRYVSLGDSTSMGYMLNNYPDTYKHDTDDESHPYSIYRQMVDYLKNTWKVKNLESTDLSLTGMRSTELRAILDESYAEKKQCDCAWDTSWNFSDSHLDYYTVHPSIKCWGSYEAIHNAYIDNIKNADLITYDCLMADFGTYFGGRFTDLDDDDYKDETLAKLLKDEGCKLVGNCVEDLSAKLTDALGGLGLPMDTVNGYLDAMLYTYANCCINFSKTMELIYKLNPDVKMIVVGPFNVMDGLTFKIDKVEIDFGSIWNIVMSSIANYVILLDKNCWRYRYADCSDGVELIIDAMKDKDYLPNHDFRFDFYEDLKVDPNDPDIDRINANIARAAAHTVLPLTDVFSNMGNEKMINNALRNDDPTDAELGVLHIALRMTVNHAIGAHPSEKGYDQKFAAVKRAFLSPVAANGAYLTRIIDDTVGLANNVVASVFGSRTSFSRLVGMIKDIFTPLVRLNIFGK